MFYLLLLVLGVSAAYADDCKGLTPDADFPNVCKSDEFRTDKERGKRIGTKGCTYSYTNNGATIKCKEKKTKDKKCKKYCNKETYKITEIIYEDYTYEKKPCNNETGLVAQSDISKFLCKNKDTGFLCKNDDYDDEVFYCGCKKAEGGTFGTTCSFITDAESTVVILAFLLAFVAFLHFVYIRRKKTEKDDRLDKALNVILCGSSLLLVVLNLIPLTTEKENGIFAAGMVVALVVLGAESYYFYIKRGKMQTVYATVVPVAVPLPKLPKTYRDNRFNII